MAKVKAKIDTEYTAQDAVNEIKEFHGADVISNGVDFHDRYISTGIYELDLALSGGLLHDQVAMLYGPSGCGKSELLALIAAEFNKKHPDKVIFWEDIEKQFKTERVKELGLDVEKLEAEGKFFIQQGLTVGESVVDSIINKAHSLDFGMLVVDSISALQTQQQTEKSVHDVTVGGLGKVVAALMRGLLDAIAEKRKRHEPCLIILINRKSKGIGPYAPTTFIGNDSQIFFSSTIMQMHKTGFDEVEVYGRNLVSSQKHEINLQKMRQKGGTKCEFQLSQHEEITGYKIGASMSEVDSIINFLESVEMWNPHKREYFRTGEKFKSKTEFSEWLRGKPEELLLLKRLSIYANRVRIDKRSGLPVDRYLLGYVSEEEEKQLEALFNEHINKKEILYKKVSKGSK